MKNARLIATCLVLVTGTTFVSVAQARRSDESRDDGPGSRIERLCSTDGATRMAAWQERSLDRTTERLKLTDAQKAAFKDLQDARAKARSDAKTALCASKPDLSALPGRLAFRQGMREQRLAGMKATSPKLLAFYNSLDAEQKVKFDEMRERMVERMRGRHHHRHRHDN